VKIAIVGSREYLDLDQVRDYVRLLPDDTVVVTGGARGVDEAAELAARSRGLKVIIHEPEWAKYGKAAGPMRNKQVVDDCDRLVAFWDGASTGAKDAISKAAKQGKLEKVFRCDNPKQGRLF